MSLILYLDYLFIIIIIKVFSIFILFIRNILLSSFLYPILYIIQRPNKKYQSIHHRVESVWKISELQLVYVAIKIMSIVIISFNYARIKVNFFIFYDRNLCMFFFTDEKISFYFLYILYKTISLIWKNSYFRKI